MTIPLLITQQVLSAFTNNLGATNGHSPPLCPTNSSTSTTPTNATMHTPHLQGLPSDFPSLISIFISFSALRQSIKVLLLGGLVDIFRRLVVHLYRTIYRSFFITGSFITNDYEAYSWIDSWLRQQKPWKLAHDIHISVDPTSDETDINYAFSFGQPKGPSIWDKVSIYPTTTEGISLWYKRHWVWVDRIVETDSQGVESSRILNLTILAWSRKVLDCLMLDAKKAHRLNEHRGICVYAAKFKYSEYQWWHMACRAKRSLQSIVLDPGVKDTLLEDARDFLASKQWYDSRGIPFRRGYLLYGAPGSGKSSLIHSIAGELKLNVYVMSLSGVGLDDDALRELVSSLPTRCILLMEDIDVALSNPFNRDPKKKDGKSSPSTTTSMPAPPALPRSRVTLSGLLNALDGIAAAEGRLLFATTNKYDALDPALCRPGRMDLHIEFKLASRYQAAQFFKYFFSPEGHQKKEESGVCAKTSGKADDTSSTILTSQVVTVGGVRHRHDLPDLSSTELSLLADLFSEAVPEREFSMASLQGYLMRYKADPHGAVAGIAEWASKEKGRREQ
ncbi:unnamed protein product [Cyclocybe aegerita]|uniref:P-loop containing nucleoside triphosphate hydrolase protein n=1 Tax=Cyclocybe aegerita TaxID=1973307 RepID=A0A8S0XGS6_CYCAE|nr:unnamed protein product [Cyclocybe aegerita]